MKKRLLLLRPDSPIATAAPPLGLLYLAAHIRGVLPSIEVRVFDCRLKEPSRREFEALIRSFAPDYVGITALHAEAAPLHALARAVKEILPGCPVIAGGPYPTGDYSALLERDPAVDFCVAGEGEYALAELLSRLEEGRSPAGTPGVAWRENGEVRYAGPGTLIADCDSLAFPAWDLAGIEEYFLGRKPYTQSSMR